MQHTPLWRSKFRILRIKKTRTKIGTLRISHTSLKLHRDIPSGSFTESDLRKIGAITGAPNENIVQNHINIALLNVLEYLNGR